MKILLPPAIAFILVCCYFQPLQGQNMNNEKLRFPKGFLWGAASAAY